MVHSQNEGTFTEREKHNKQLVPPRLEEPKLVPIAEAKGFPNPAPRGAWVPEAEREQLFYSSEPVSYMKRYFFPRPESDGDTVSSLSTYDKS